MTNFRSKNNYLLLQSLSLDVIGQAIKHGSVARERSSWFFIHFAISTPLGYPEILQDGGITWFE